VLSKAVWGRDAVRLQLVPSLSEIRDLNAQVVDDAATMLSRCLVVDIELTGPDRQQDISRTSQTFVNHELGLQVSTPPLDCLFDIAWENVDMMEVEGHRD